MDGRTPRPVLTRKPSDLKPGRKAENRPTITPTSSMPANTATSRAWDVEAGASAAMGEGNIHDTQVRVAASLIHAGQPIEEDDRHHHGTNARGRWGELELAG